MLRVDALVVVEHEERSPTKVVMTLVDAERLDPKKVERLLVLSPLVVPLDMVQPLSTTPCTTAASCMIALFKFVICWPYVVGVSEERESP